MNYFEKIIMRRKTIVLIATMYVSLFMLQMLGRAEEQRPNFLVILCDDLGWGDLGCFGHPHIRTNYLDQLARDGCRLTHCYSAAPVCSPSRVGLMTGRSPNRAGIFDWIPQANENGPATSKLSRHLVHLRKQEQTLPKLLRDSGYATALSGKWHATPCSTDRSSLNRTMQVSSIGLQLKTMLVHLMKTQRILSAMERVLERSMGSVAN
jgi:hypothetical protein